MVEIASIYYVIQILLVLTLIFGSYYGRKLNLTWHHRLIYGVLIVELIVFAIWMGPGVLYYASMGGITTVLGLHITVGSLSFLSSATLAIVFLRKRNGFDIQTLRWTRPLMIFSLFIWITAFLLGTIFYLQTY